MEKKNVNLNVKPKSEKFKPPTIDDVIDFFENNGYSADVGKTAWKYYEDLNWHDSTGKKVVSWKQKMRAIWFKDTAKNDLTDVEKTPYSEKLKHPKWQKKRLEVMQRDNFECKLCGDQETTLHVHHKEYINGREPWEYEDYNFITLCKHCHVIVEIVKKYEGDIHINQIQKSKATLRCLVFAFSYTHNEKVFGHFRKSGDGFSGDLFVLDEYDCNEIRNWLK